MKLLIGADFVPTKSNAELFQCGDVATLVGEELLEIIKAQDYRIFNMELPLTDVSTPIDKSGPVLSAPTAAVVGYKAFGVDLFTIANNHILDHGAQGLLSSIEQLQANQIAFLGGGTCLDEAKKPYILNCDGKKIGIYACVENEFSIAKKDSPGANPYDPLESFDDVAALKEICDRVIVLYHGGKEHYRYPSPNLQKVCRKFVEKGADLVLCQHSHCIGCEEKYLDSTIVYGQGNFLFDISNSECWQTSLLVQIDGDFNVSYLPLEKQSNTVRLAVGDRAKEILDAFYARSEEIKIPGVVEEKYLAQARNELNRYLLSFLAAKPRSFWMRAINRLTGQRWTKWLLSHKYDKRSLLAIRNSLRCEAHYELLNCGIDDLIEGK